MQVANPNLERGRLYSDPNTRELLRRMLMGNVLLEPTVGPDGKVHYPMAEEVLGEGINVQSWLAEMVEQKVIVKHSSKEIVVCPIHSRADPMVSVECLKCKSRHSVKRSLEEHAYCGYIGDDARFDKGGKLQGPNCGRPIMENNELKGSGGWYECQICLSKPCSPRFVFLCKEGNHDFYAADLAVASVDSYAVNEQVVSELKNTLLLDPDLAAMMQAIGFKVQSPAQIQGQSGARHSLDVYAEKDGETVALQVAVDTKPVESGAVISFFAKTFDIKPGKAVLVTIPAASEEAKRLEAGYGVLLVEDYDGSGVVNKVKLLLEKEGQG